MEYYSKVYNHPLEAEIASKIEAFWHLHDFGPEPNLTQTVVFFGQDGQIIASGSRRDNVLCLIGVLSQCEGLEMASAVVSLLLREAAKDNYSHLFIYTKASLQNTFTALGFFTLAVTPTVALLENKRYGLQNYLQSLKEPQINASTAKIGAIVLNANPLTRGHLHLIHTAKTEVDHLYLFLLRHEGNDFSFAERMSLLKAETQGLEHLTIADTGDYLVSNATFPSYFLGLNDKTTTQVELDATIFGSRFAPVLGITHRFIGTEPYSTVTSAYNQMIERLLPQYGVTPVIVPRLNYGDKAISASEVRRLWRLGEFESLKPLVPTATLEFLRQKR